MKWLFGIIVSLLILAFGLIPEIIMYFLYGVIKPETALEKSLVLLGFIGLGGGLCVLFGLIAVVVWVHVIVAILD